MVEVKERRIANGCDWWGRTEYDTFYVVVDESCYEIFRSTKDPSRLIEKIREDCEKTKK